MGSIFDALPDRLREERKRLGLNQTQFAALGGVTLKTQSRNEQKVSQIDTNYYDYLAKYGVDTIYVITGVRSLASADAAIMNVPNEIKPLVDAFINLWLSKTLDTSMLDTWVRMVNQMNPSITPPESIRQPVASESPGARTPTGTDPETGVDMSLFSRRPN